MALSSSASSESSSSILVPRPGSHPGNRRAALTTFDNLLPDINQQEEDDHTVEEDDNDGDHHCGFKVPIPRLTEQQQVYRIGVLAIRGVESAHAQWALTFGDYLTATAGRQFDPPLSFEMVPVPFGLEREPADEFIHGNYDFVYANPSMFSCVDSEVGLNTLVSHISKRKVHGNVYALTEFGGVIFTWAGNDEIHTLEDLKEKRLGLVNIAGLGSGQMQFREMIKAGLHHLQDPKQLIFLENQNNVVKAVLNREIDIGFVRTDQLDRFIDPATDQLLDQSKVKIINPVDNYLAEDGSPFPFTASTVLYPEWALASFPSVGQDVERHVQRALMDLAQHATAAKALTMCMEDRNCTNINNDNLACEQDCFRHANPYGYQTCDVDADTTLLADLAQTAGKYAGWRSPLSYMTIRNMQEEIGYIQHNNNNNKDGSSSSSFQCLRGETLADSVVCPEGHFKKTVEDIATGCEDLGMPCYGFACLCKPCVKSYDVDVFPIGSATTTLAASDEGNGANTNSTITNNHHHRQAGCSKFDICGSVQQSHQIAFRAIDNKRRQNATFTAVINGEFGTEEYQMMRVPQSSGKGEQAGEEIYAYEFVYNALDNKVGFLILQVQVLEQQHHGASALAEQVSQSPFRLAVEPRDCAADTGDPRRVPNANGECICESSSLEIVILGSSQCVPLAVFIPSVIVPIVVLAGIVMFCYFVRKRRKEDLIWKINSDELTFDDPPHVLGKGRFGMVHLGKYRGTEVAVKQLLDPKLLHDDDDSSEGSLAPLSQEGGKLIALPTAKDGDVEQCPIPDRDESNADIGIRSCLYVPENKNHKKTSSQGSGLLSLVESAVGNLSTATGGLNNEDNLKEEMRLLSKLRHPNVVTIMGCTEDHRLVMEYMELGCMSEVLRTSTMVIDDAKVLSMIQDVARGLHFLHATDPFIVHGDLKAQNVLVDSKFRAKVSDFGLSKHLKGRKANIASGTPFWMAPEVLVGDSTNTTMSDVYSFGVLLYEAYTRQYPYAGEDPQTVLSEVTDPVVNKRPPIPKRCPMAVAEIMEACFHRDPERRPVAGEIDEKLASITQTGTRDQALVWELFPRHVAAAIRDGKTVEPETHENVSVLVSNIVGHESLELSLSPTKVSNLLDRLYSKFENLCDLHNVFRLLTVGNGFMCATNLAEKQHDHMRSIAAFAADALKAAACTLIDEEDATKGYVSIRIGIASGQVVSHVVGSRTPRYAILGNTVNAASKLESLCVPGRAQCTEASANFLKDQDPEADLFLRGGVKISGEQQVVTYWIGEPVLPGSEPVVAAPQGGDSNNNNDLGSLIEWNVDVLARIIREIVAARDTNLSSGVLPDFSHLANASQAGTIIDEVEEVVSLPQFDIETVKRMRERQSVVLPPDVMPQLRDFVTEIANMYDNNVPFHNFQHASHVTLSVVRLLTRIKAVPTEASGADISEEEKANMSLHQCSYGIASDPICQLAIVLSALIHDTDHQGVPNAQLVKENQEIAIRYKGRSVAEQNSIALAWALFMDEKFSELRHTIAQTEEEITRFRQLVINCVMATDIVDKALKQLRNNRWETAFSGEISETEERAVNRKATIVIEHIIQASDIGHTMQQWHVYRKWNARFFAECYKAYKDGRAENDPSKGWYKGEIGFFDFYIIPLAKKLQQSGVFGVYGDEYVKNAQANRDEWVECGEHVVSEMINKMQADKMQQNFKAGGAANYQHNGRGNNNENGSGNHSQNGSGKENDRKANRRRGARTSPKRRNSKKSLLG